MEKIAHIDEEREQSVYEHLENVAKKTAEFCSEYDITSTDVQAYAYEVGLVHDLGKYSEAFQNKIRGNLNISVDHSTAGARELVKLRMMAGAFAVSGHHGGIPNGWDTTKSNLMERVKKRKLEPYEDYQSEICFKGIKEPELSAYEEAFFIRMLFSALVDADFLDTEKFMSKDTVARGNYDSIEKLYSKLINYIAPWRNIAQKTPELNKIRTGILEQCLSAGSGERGLYSLTVPTGGGKTVSSLAFALEHAKTNGMQRIIYVIPYTSIIEQNVAVFREILGEQNVLAHYSGSLLSSEDQDDYHEKHKLSIENWDAPVIVTTNVQFFESFYSNKVSKCRKLHNVSNSVVIFDEVQMIPLNYLKPCVKAIQSLVEHYRVSAVLCTATQPALEKWMKPLVPKEICSNYAELFQKLKRTQIKDIGEILEEDLAEKMTNVRQVLTIVNLKAEAQRIYQNLPQEGAFHLSTYMTPFDRKNTLQKIRECLRNGEVCRVVSTSLVEAGVDLDFPIVFRELAGLDSIIQAAGRCNREGNRRQEESIVGVFHLKEIPKLIEKNISITKETYQKYGEYEGLEAIHYYFSALQNLDEESLDQHHIIDSFLQNFEGIQMPFQKISEIFHLIESDTRMLIIPRQKEAARLVEELDRRVKEQENFKCVLQKLGEYSINIFDWEYKAMLDDASAYEIVDGISVLQNLFLYSEKMGLHYKKNGGAIII